MTMAKATRMKRRRTRGRMSWRVVSPRQFRELKGFAPMEMSEYPNDGIMGSGRCGVGFWSMLSMIPPFHCSMGEARDEALAKQF
jgi:hypothetical protein